MWWSFTFSRASHTHTPRDKQRNMMTMIICSLFEHETLSISKAAANLHHPSKHLIDHSSNFKIRETKVHMIKTKKRLISEDMELILKIKIISPLYEQASSWSPGGGLVHATKVWHRRSRKFGTKAERNNAPSNYNKKRFSIYQRLILRV